MKRNRIIAGMADATIVIESDVKGGSLITAEMANGYNRDVFTLPGRVGDRHSTGCHGLVMHNRAALITSGSDVLKAMAWDDGPRSKKTPPQPKLLLNLSPEQEKVVAVLKECELPIDRLTLQCEMPMSKVATVLLELEFDGIVNCLPGKVYKLV